MVKCRKISDYEQIIDYLQWPAI